MKKHAFLFFLSLITLSPNRSFSETVQDNASCQIEKITELPFYNTGYSLWVPASLQNYAVSFILDTGSEGSLLTPEIAQKFSLPSLKEEMLVTGADGGKSMTPLVEIPKLTLNNLIIHRLILPLGVLSGIPLLPRPIIGIIGMNILSQYDIELNLPKERLTLWHSHAHSLLCQNPLLEHGKWTIIHLTPLGNRFLIPFTLDGHKAIALLDTGARSHILSLDFAHKIGITDEELSRDPTGINSSIGGKHAKNTLYHWHKFHLLSIAQEREKDPILTVAPLQGKADMLLGADWFLKHHLWLSPQKNLLFIEQ